MQENSKTKVNSINNNSNAIVFSANDFYCPYLCVLLHSLIRNANKKDFYDIIILNTDITQTNKDIIERLIMDRNNISIRFINVNNLVNNDLYIGGKNDISIETYFRLYIPYVLDNQYKKALYLDSDMLVMKDVYPLFSENIDDYLLASTKDYSSIGCYNIPHKDIKQYRKSIGIKDLNNYFISGMLLMNLDKFRELYTLEDIINFALSKNFRQHDQDVLNILCNNNLCKIIDPCWDVLKPLTFDWLSKENQKEVEQSIKNPAIVHFADKSKPWKNNLSPWTKDFWQECKETEYYDIILDRLLSSVSPSVTEKVIKMFKCGQLSFRYLLRCVKAWLLK